MARVLVSAAIVAALSVSPFCGAFSPAVVLPSSASSSLPSSTCLQMSDPPSTGASSSRRSFFGQSAALTLGALTASKLTPTVGGPVEAVGPVKISLNNPVYKAAPCPPSRPIPGEKAMKGMRGLCVTVNADLDGAPDKDLEKVGVYGYVTDAESGESVLANNPDGGTDAGQFAIIESVTTKDKKVEFEFIAAVPMEKNVADFDNGIGPLSFGSLRIVSFPGGQQYGAINPCEMNEFSDECDAWEEENGPYKKGEFMIKSNPRTKGR
mmetsp:Transcript_12695/g.26890  ORF Transcript_12695/g.26890 Transcript_12695/m.26890 type:complete len:266 (+) Transcript_12695:50-847(+)